MARVLGDDWLLPKLDERNRAFFTSGKLTFQRCEACGHVQHPPEDVCERCQGFAFDGFESEGRGRVETVAVVTHPLHAGFADRVPYAVVLVSVDDVPGILVTGNVTNRPADDVAIGDPVRVTFEVVEDDGSGETYRIPQWEIA